MLALAPSPADHDTDVSSTSNRIDMISPSQACAALQVSEQSLLAMVNSGQLAAYRFNNSIRFRQTDVEASANHRG